MNLEKFTLKAQEALMSSQALTQEKNNNEVDVLHLAYVLVDSDETIIDILKEMNVDVEGIKKDIEKEIDKLPKVYNSKTALYISPLLNQTIYKAQNYAKIFEDEYIGVEHLFML